MIGALLLIMFATRTGDAFPLATASSTDAGSSPVIAVMISTNNHETTGTDLD
jgi:hypothetical protein